MSWWIDGVQNQSVLKTRIISSNLSGPIKQIPRLTHWGRVTHICISRLTIIGSDNGLSPGRHQAIIWTNAGILLIWPLGTNFSEILIEIYIFSFMKMHLKLSSGVWRPFCLGLNVLTDDNWLMKWIPHGFWLRNQCTQQQIMAGNPFETLPQFHSCFSPNEAYMSQNWVTPA